MSKPVIVTKRDHELAQAEKHKRWGLLALGVLVVLFLMPVFFEPEVRAGVEALPPEIKTVVFQVDPPGIPGTTMVLTSEDGEQQLVADRTPTELRLAGKVQWTVIAPGFRGAHGDFEVPYGATNRIISLPVQLKPSATSRRQNRRGFGRINAGGTR